MRGEGGQRPYITFTCKVGAHVVCSRVHATCVYMHHKIDVNLRGGQAVMKMAMYATPHASTTASQCTPCLFH